MPWKTVTRKCKQKSTGKSGTHVVVKIKKSGGTEQESCHTSKEKAQAAIRARYANETDVPEEEMLREYVRKVLTETVSFEINGIPVSTEYADTDEKRAMGLSGRHTLGDNEGMLFRLDKLEPTSFWMKDTYVPLSIAFIDNTGTITVIKDMQPESLSSVSSGSPALYALEMPQGWFDKHNLAPGHKVTGIPEV